MLKIVLIYLGKKMLLHLLFGRRTLPGWLRLHLVAFIEGVSRDRYGDIKVQSVEFTE